VNELHGVVVHAALAADRVDGEDVGVVERSGRPRLIPEALEVTRIHDRGQGQHLECNPTAQRQLLGLVDDPVPPRPTSRRIRKPPRRPAVARVGGEEINVGESAAGGRARKGSAGSAWRSTGARCGQRRA
jgi:hypothetical protein